MRVEMDFSMSEVEGIIGTLEENYHENGQIINSLLEKVLTALRTKLDEKVVMEVSAMNSMLDEYERMRALGVTGKK